jgi:hypothetical protein
MKAFTQWIDEQQPARPIAAHRMSRRQDRDSIVRLEEIRQELFQLKQLVQQGENHAADQN